MAKYKPAGRKAVAKSNARGLLPCLFIVLFGFLVLFGLFYSMLKST